MITGLLGGKRAGGHIPGKLRQCGDACGQDATMTVWSPGGRRTSSRNAIGCARMRPADNEQRSKTLKVMDFRRLARRLARRFGPPHLALALQGGGSHGAFTWGVLDRLLEAGMPLAGVSGASAGAMNGAALVAGLVRGGPTGARRTLEDLWRTVAEQSLAGPLQSTPLEHLLHGWNRDYSPGIQLLKGITRVASPYQLNPTGHNPLRAVLEAVIDFDALRHASACPLFISLTNVRSGRMALHRNRQIGVDSLLASACLPLLFQAVRVDGEHYWDGGYTGNPALSPLLLECAATDVLLIQLTPEEHDRVPTQVPEIMERINDLTFHASLVRELQLLASLQRAGRLRGMAGIRFHQVKSEDDTRGMGADSRINAAWSFICHLRDRGRERAGQWLDEERSPGGNTRRLRLEDYLP